MERRINRLWPEARSRTRRPRLYALGSWEEEVPGAPDGFEISRPFGIIIEFMAQATDRHIDGSIVCVPIDSANTLHNLIPIHDRAGVVKKECQDFKFGSGEIKDGAVQPCRSTTQVDY